MKKDVLMLVYDEPDWEQNYQLAVSIFGNVKLIHGSPTMLASFTACAAACSTDLMVMIDGDNQVFPNAKDEVERVNSPTVFFTTNSYGIKYGHGGIKIISKHANFNSGASVDISERLSLPATPVVISKHGFDTSAYNHWRTVFKEVIKQKLWGNQILFDAWVSNDFGKAVYEYNVVPYLKRSTIREVYALLSNNVGLRSEYLKAIEVGTPGLFSLLAEDDELKDISGF